MLQRRAHWAAFAVESIKLEVCMFVQQKVNLLQNVACRMYVSFLWDGQDMGQQQGPVAAWP
jgi:hypothetical protein